jgi:hypothetical protein
MHRQAGLGVWIWNAATSEPNIAWEGRQPESEKMIGVITYGMSLEHRAVIRFLWLKHTSYQAILSEFEEVWGKDAIPLQAVEK